MINSLILHSNTELDLRKYDIFTHTALKYVLGHAKYGHSGQVAVTRHGRAIGRGGGRSEG